MITIVTPNETMHMNWSLAELHLFIGCVNHLLKNLETKWSTLYTWLEENLHVKASEYHGKAFEGRLFCALIMLFMLFEFFEKPNIGNFGIEFWGNLILVRLWKLQKIILQMSYKKCLSKDPAVKKFWLRKILKSFCKNLEQKIIKNNTYFENYFSSTLRNF